MYFYILGQNRFFMFAQFYQRSTISYTRNICRTWDKPIGSLFKSQTSVRGSFQHLHKPVTQTCLFVRHQSSTASDGTLQNEPPHSKRKVTPKQRKRKTKEGIGHDKSGFAVVSLRMDMKVTLSTNPKWCRKYFSDLNIFQNNIHAS